MNRKNERNITSKTINWVIYSFIIFLWFLVNFGISPVLEKYTKLNTILITGLIISGIGSTIIIVSLYSPSFFIKFFFELNPYEKSRYQGTISFACGLIGLFLLSCGLVYSFTGNVIYLVISFTIPIFFHTVLSKWNL